MFKNIFPDHLNKLVYMGGTETPKEARKNEPTTAVPVDVQSIGRSAVGERLAKLPESNTVRALRLTEAIFQASGTRTRFEAMRPDEARRMASSIGKEVQALMKDKKELQLPAPNGNTLLIKKFDGGGIVAVAYEARGNDRADKPAQHLVVGNVPNAVNVAFDMALAFKQTELFKKQEAVAKATRPRSSTPFNMPA